MIEVQTGNEHWLHYTITQRFTCCSSLADPSSPSAGEFEEDQGKTAASASSNFDDVFDDVEQGQLPFRSGNSQYFLAGMQIMLWENNKRIKEKEEE